MLQKQWWGKNAGVWTRTVAPNCTDSHRVLLQCALANKRMLASLRNVFDKTVQMIGSIKSLLKFTLQNGTYAQSSFAAQRRCGLEVKYRVIAVVMNWTSCLFKDRDVYLRERLTGTLIIQAWPLVGISLRMDEVSLSLQGKNWQQNTSAVNRKFELSNK